QRVDRKIEQNLKKIGPIDCRKYVLGKLMNRKIVPMRARMAQEQLLQVVQDLIHTDTRMVDGSFVQETEISARDLEAASDLAGEFVEIALDCLKLLTFQAGGVLNRAVNHFNEPGNDRQRAVNIVQHARVNLA